MLDRESVMPCLPGRPRSAAVCAAAETSEDGKPCEIVLRVENQHIVLFIGENILAEFRAERGEALVDLGEPRLGCVRQAAAIAHKGGMIAIENPQLFGVEAEFALAPMKRGDPLKQRVVQIDVALMAGELWRDLPFDRFDFVIGVGAREIEENRANRSRSRPLLSSASIVFSKDGGSGFFAIAATSACAPASALSKAGAKWLGFRRSKGGASNGPVHGWSSGFSGGELSLSMVRQSDF